MKPTDRAGLTRAGVLVISFFSTFPLAEFVSAQPPRVISCAAPVTAEGFHDSASCQMMVGWAWDSAQPNTPLVVDILSDGAPHASILANVFRQDLLNAGKGNGVHGFRYRVPESVRDSVPHSMLVRFGGTTTSLTFSPRTIQCPPPTRKFKTITPCRAVDTRNPVGPYGGPALAAGATRFFAIGGVCGIPATAEAVSLNVTVVTPPTNGSLRIFPDGVNLPSATAISYSAALVRANNGVIALGAGALGVYCDQPSGTAHVIIDVNGYFE